MIGKLLYHCAVTSKPHVGVLYSDIYNYVIIQNLPKQRPRLKEF